jgi:hypothetical protein
LSNLAMLLVISFLWVQTKECVVCFVCGLKLERDRAEFLPNFNIESKGHMTRHLSSADMND